MLYNSSKCVLNDRLKRLFSFFKFTTHIFIPFIKNASIKTHQLTVIHYQPKHIKTTQQKSKEFKLGRVT